MWENEENSLQNPAHILQFLVGKELQYKSGHTAIDADEEVETGQDHIGCAGHREQEGGWVHEWGDGPAI